MQIKIQNKKHLSMFLEVLLLKGLDPRGKENPNFENCLLKFSSDEDGDIFLQCYGRNSGNSIFFHHTLSLEEGTEMDGDFDLAISDISLWMKYIKDLKGDAITIKVDDGFVFLEGTDASYYQIPETDIRSITSLNRLEDGPILSWDPEVKNTELFDHYKEKPISDEIWSIYKFEPDKLADATDSGKNIETLTTQFTFKKNKVDIEVGNLPQAGVGPKFVNNNIDGIECVNWIWGDNVSKSWVSIMGVNPVCRALSIVNTGDPKLMYKSPAHNMLIVDIDATIGKSSLILIWMISAITEHEGEFVDASVPEVEG